MAAAMGRQHTDTGHFEQGVAVLVPEMAGVHGLSGDGAFPYEFSGLFPEEHRAGPDIGRHRHVPDAGGTFGRADIRGYVPKAYPPGIYFEVLQKLNRASGTVTDPVIYRELLGALRTLQEAVTVPAKIEDI